MHVSGNQCRNCSRFREPKRGHPSANQSLSCLIYSQEYTLYTFFNIRVKFSIPIETLWKDLNCGGHQVLSVRSLEKLGTTCSNLVERLVDLTGSVLKAKSSDRTTLGPL